MSQLSGNIFVFHVDQVLLELFQFTHEALFGTPFIFLTTEQI